MLVLLLSGMPACATGKDSQASTDVTRTAGGSPQAAAGTANAPLTIRLGGFRKPEGVARVAVYSSPDGFLSNDTKALAKSVHDVTSGDNQVVFDLPPGIYAVAVLHDENSNGKVETNILGIPKEGVSTSNNPHPKFRAPNFVESKFELPPNGTTIDIKMKYY